MAKIAGNMMIMLAIEAMGEATALTESYGPKAGDFLVIVNNTMFASSCFEPGFKLLLGLKASICR